MKKLLKVLIVIISILLVIFLIVFALAKAKIVYINKWFVNEKQSVIGVDISSYQADVDMNILKNQDIEFVYIKASEGSSHQDEYFKDNWNNAKKVGLVSGAYHFFSYDSPGITQAQNFIEIVGEDIKGRLLPVVDVEYYGDKEINPPKKQDVIRELSSYLNALEKQYDVKPMIYTRSDIYDKYLKGTFDSYPYWISSLYTPIRWKYNGDWYIWQYLNVGELQGYQGGEKYIDLNVLNKNKSLEELIVK